MFNIFIFFRRQIDWFLGAENLHKLSNGKSQSKATAFHIGSHPSANKMHFCTIKWNFLVVHLCYLIFALGSRNFFRANSLFCDCVMHTTIKLKMDEWQAHIFSNWMRKNQQILGWIKMNTSFVRMTSFSLHYFSVSNFFLLRIDCTFSCILLCYFAKKMSCLDYFGSRKIQRYITIAGEHRTEKLWKTKRIGDSHMCVRIAGIRSNVN